MSLDRKGDKAEMEKAHSTASLLSHSVSGTRPGEDLLCKSAYVYVYVVYVYVK